MHHFIKGCAIVVGIMVAVCVSAKTSVSPEVLDYENGSTSVFEGQQAVYDSLYYLTGDVIAVNIAKNSSDEVECTYPGESMLSVITKAKLWKIRFRSGRVEICNDLDAIAESNSMLDTLVFRNGEKYAVTVKESDGETVTYSFPGESSLNTMYKVQLSSVIYASGRTEDCSALLKIKEITNKSQWKEVVVTYNESDVRGLEKVKELSKASGWGGMLASGKGYDKAIKRLQKAAAKIKCGLVLIHGQTNRITSAMGAGSRATASAYRLPANSQGKASVSEPEASSETAKGSIGKKSKATAIRLGRGR